MTFKFKSWKTAVFGMLGAVGILAYALCTQQTAVGVSGAPALVQVSTNLYSAVSNYKVKIQYESRTYTILIRSGFLTDGASIPQFVRERFGLYPLSPSLVRGALVHDALYDGELVPRDLADELFYTLIVKDGTEIHKADAIYVSVHYCGQIVWDQHTPESVAEARKFVSVVVD